MPLLRSLEREFKNNIIYPFHYSTEYTKIDKSKKHNIKDKVHFCLQKKGNPTLGSIPYIGKSLISNNYHSDVIELYSQFLGDKKENIIDICQKIDAYRIGINKLGLVQIRNAIAHGDEKLTNMIDNSYCVEIKKFLLDEPIQLFQQILTNSLKKRF